jgi:hypothetical protein
MSNSTIDHQFNNRLIQQQQDVLQQLAQSQLTEAPLVSLAFLEASAITSTTQTSTTTVTTSTAASSDDVSSKVQADVFYGVVWDKFWSEMLPALERRWAEAPGESR